MTYFIFIQWWKQASIVQSPSNMSKCLLDASVRSVLYIVQITAEVYTCLQWSNCLDDFFWLRYCRETLSCTEELVTLWQMKCLCSVPPGPQSEQSVLEFKFPLRHLTLHAFTTLLGLIMSCLFIYLCFETVITAGLRHSLTRELSQSKHKCHHKSAQMWNYSGTKYESKVQWLQGSIIQLSD